ncbi:GtrA family protein [Enterococcus sp. AD013-P3]|uniref:GtrA family protein n=1 Tax=Enterococcus sp. AD013-P3 TaxID=3411036 RepID=UPI003B935AFF
MKLYNRFRTELEKRHLWEVFIYLFFGGLTTVVNFVVFFLAKDLAHLSLVPSNTLAWIGAVLFAFVTNKLWVFHSKTETPAELAVEFGKFIFYRLLSYAIDMGAMLLLVNVLHMGDFWSKMVTQVLVVVANYVFSKLFIFKNKSEVVILEENNEQSHK